MKTDFELERLCSFKDINNYTLPLYCEINKKRKEIEWAYITVLQMLGYDTVKIFKMSIRKIRALTLTAVVSEFMSELIELSTLVKPCNGGLKFIISSKNETYKIGLLDIALIIDLMIKYWNQKNTGEE